MDVTLHPNINMIIKVCFVKYSARSPIIALFVLSLVSVVLETLLNSVSCPHHGLTDSSIDLLIFTPVFFNQVCFSALQFVLRGWMFSVVLYTMWLICLVRVISASRCCGNERGPHRVACKRSGGARNANIIVCSIILLFLFYVDFFVINLIGYKIKCCSP